MYLLKKVINLLTRIDKKITKVKPVKSPVDIYIKNGKSPWSSGYTEYKWENIEQSIYNQDILNSFIERQLPAGYGIGIDERIIEYPWIFNQLSNKPTKLLDAGSTFNFKPIIEHPLIKQKELTIFTYYPEPDNFINNRISYMFGDLRSLPFQSAYFDEVVSHSTIEHIDMNNKIYGYELSYNNDLEKKSYEYINAISELIRVLKPSGMLVISFPYGKFEHHEYFQQFDAEMTNLAIDLLKQWGTYSMEFIKYKNTGWEFAEQELCNHIENYNPNTGRGKLDDGAAHSRCICFIKFMKN